METEGNKMNMSFNMLLMSFAVLAQVAYATSRFTFFLGSIHIYSYEHYFKIRLYGCICGPFMLMMCDAA
jgi:hypothetical protein